MAAVGVVVQGGNDIGIGPSIGRNVLNSNTSGAIFFPAILAGPQDLVLAFGASRAVLGFGNSALPTTPPTGFTSLESVQLADSPGSTANWGSFVFSAPASAAAVSSWGGGWQSVAMPTSCYLLGTTLSITPAKRPLTERMPTSFQGISAYCYGESLQCYVGNGGVGMGGHYSEVLIFDHITNRMAPAHKNNFGLSGAYVSDITGFAYGTVSYFTQSLSGDVSDPTSQPGTWLSNPSLSPAFVWIDATGNDCFNDAAGGTNTKARASAQNGVDALIRLLRASSAKWVGDASIVKTVGFGTTVTANDYGGGSVYSSTASGDKITVTTTQPSIDLVLMALDDTAMGVTGSTFSVTVDGTLHSTGTVSNQAKKSGSGTYKQSDYTQMCVPCYGMGAGTHTIVLQNTATGTLQFNGYLIPSATPPVIVIDYTPHLSDAFWSNFHTIAGYGPSTAAAGNLIVDIYNGLVNTVVSQFTDGNVLIYDPNQSGLWNNADGPASGGGMVNPSDHGHPNDWGTTHYPDRNHADSLRTILRTSIAFYYSEYRGVPHVRRAGRS